MPERARLDRDIPWWNYTVQIRGVQKTTQVIAISVEHTEGFVVFRDDHGEILYSINAVLVADVLRGVQKSKPISETVTARVDPHSGHVT